jgi:hypothetical protein
MMKESDALVHGKVLSLGPQTRAKTPHMWKNEKKIEDGTEC